jgi:hypothetical protein
VVVAVPAVRVVQVPRDQIVGVVGVWDDLVPATRAMSVALVVSAAGVRGCAGRGVCASRSQGALIDVVAVYAMQVSVVEVIRVVAVLDHRVPTFGPVGMGVAVMGVVLFHAFASLRCSERPSKP